MYKHILAPTDGSEVARKGVDRALELAKALSARVTIIAVTEPLPAYPGSFGHANLGVATSAAAIFDFAVEQGRAASALLDDAKQSADRQGVSAETLLVQEAQPAEAIIEAAKSRECDLIVMASHGRRGLSRLLLGSKTAEVVAQSHVPVLVVR